MPIATSTIIITGAAAGFVGIAVQNRRLLPGRRRPPLVALLHIEPDEERDDPRQAPLTEDNGPLRNLDNAYQAIFQNYIDPLLVGRRHREINAIRLQHQSLEEAEVEYAINHHLGISTAALVTAGLGYLGMPALLGVSVGLTIFGSADIFGKAYHHLVHERRLSDELIVSLAVGTALATGFYIANAMTEVFYFTGEKLMVITENRARSKFIDTWSQLPRNAWRLEGGAEIEVPVTELEVGDTIIVHAGQLVPVDGEVIDGYAQLDQHMLTGEAQPVEKQAGDSVYAATLVFSGTLTVRVNETGLDTVALQITDILNNTLSHETQTQARARTWADQWAPVSLSLSALAGATVGATGMIAVLNTGVGTNAKITAPIALLNYLNVAMRSEILIKDGRSMDLLRDVDTVVFDKTGTLTLEQPTVREIHTFVDVDPLTILTYAAAAERRQAHPIALAILQAAEEHDLDVPHIRDAHYEIGYGIQVMVADVRVQIGSRRYMAMGDVALCAASDAVQATCDSVGHSLVYLALDGVLAGAVELEPTIRPEAASVIGALRARGLDIAIISGDQEEPTRKLAADLGIPNYFANTLPEHKAALVESLQEEGRSVCFVGDGINDGIALKKAHISVSLRGATTVAMDAAQILLVSRDLTRLPDLFELAHDYSKNMRAGYLATVVPGLAFIGAVFAFGWGIYPALMAYNASLLAGVGISLAPSRRAPDDHDPQIGAPDDQPQLEDGVGANG